jgi:hypothetical protein
MRLNRSIVLLSIWAICMACFGEAARRGKRGRASGSRQRGDAGKHTSSAAPTPPPHHHSALFFELIPRFAPPLATAPTSTAQFVAPAATPSTAPTSTAQFVAPAAKPSAPAFVTPAAPPPPADLTPDLAGEPIPPGPPVADEEAPPLDEAAAAPEGLVKAVPTPAPAPAPKKRGPGGREGAAAALPASDLTYSVTARRATLDPAGGKLTLEGVAPIIAGIRTDTTEAGAAVRSGRRSTAVRFFGPALDRNGSWLGSPSAVLYGTLDASRSGGGKSEVALPLRLTAAAYSAASGNAAFRAVQLDGPWNATYSGGVSNSVLDARGIAALKADRRVTLQDPLLLIDALYSRPAFGLEADKARG